jgi:uncharacterized protein DUF4384
VSLRRLLRAALTLWAVAVAGCGVIDSERLTDAQRVIADIKIGPAVQRGEDLQVVATAEHADRRYRVGEPIVLSVHVNQPAYVAVLRVLPSGVTTLIFPNRRHPNAQLAANTPLRLPEPGDPHTIAVDKPGVALFEFVAATGGNAWLFNRKPQEGADFAELGTTTRAIARDIVLSLGPGRATAAASHLVLRVSGD